MMAKIPVCVQAPTEMQEASRGSPDRLHDVIIGHSDDETESMLSGALSDDDRRDSQSLLPGRSRPGQS